ncbi:glutamate racemase [Polynucleobacter wuianus]|uniref:Glutamate racemase n=1 Tax=Polynucleobacter wuianus TaxID=1743168 RepID=A0A191UIL8_9BURK|nr:MULTISPECIES: glutamate racemase [Polynucleobacter]ANJ00757.1 glutamate racemase [Polynucleobacter wuianus]MBU3552547.1 glutamate racemase [Polynucleobacter sp. MWH-Post4-6-1]MBU3610456.1 glutamate racemase [Polynucleobacter wuianus]
MSLIGVFDSGVGGLSILDEALRQLPQHDYIYLADSANAPYGEKSGAWIAERSLILCKYLADAGCDAIVLACNTATAEAIKQIREQLQIPVIGVEPGIKPAAMQSQNGVVGVLATEATLKSDKFNALLATLPNDCRFIKQAGAGLVPLIEAGKADSEEALDLLAKHLEPILEAGSDTLVLGCTHYPFLRTAIRKLLGDSITLIDTSDAVVRQLKRQLELLASDDKLTIQDHGSVNFVSSKDDAVLLQMAQNLMHSNLEMHAVKSQMLGNIK